MSSKVIDQKEYLKKYLSNDKKTKKKKKKSSSKATVKIIDDDATDFQTDTLDEELLFAGEDAPQVVEIIDERPDSMKNELDNRKKWMSLSASNEQKEKEKIKVEFGRSNDKDSSPPRRNKDRDSSPPRRDRDISPPRKYRDSSPPRRSRDDFSPKKRDADQSPPRRRNKDLSPARRKDADMSPPRKNRGRGITPPRKHRDQSPPRRERKDLSPKRSREDQSPPRKRNKDNDMSPPRRHRDQSPPRRARGDLSPRRKLEDQSPPRKRDTDMSPPRRKRDQSPPRRSEGDMSPPRRKRERVSRFDKSPPRPADSPQRDEGKDKMSKTLDGKLAGLQSAKSLKTEIESLREKENKLFENLSSDVSGRNAEVRVRNRSYRRGAADKDEAAEKQKAEREQKKKEIYSRWNRGVKQVQAFESQMSEEMQESAKPLARYSDDADLEDMLKNQERQGDPMLEYMRKKAVEKKGDVIAMPVYKGPFPDNRFNIRPGYRWDGLDRSNGYEKKWFEVQNQKVAMQEEAYRYSTEDM